MLSVGGGLYLVGVAKPEVSLDVNIFGAIGGQKRVLGVNYGSTNFSLVSKRIALRDVNDGYAALKDGMLNRVVITSF
jgi:S-(hydroxymethyl)glutathione dehydrogenase/alcohol dehydrogenase